MVKRSQTSSPYDADAGYLLQQLDWERSEYIASNSSSSNGVQGS